MAHVYNKTSEVLGRGTAPPRLYNKTRDGALASEQRQDGTPSDSMMATTVHSMTATTVYNKTSAPEALVHRYHGWGGGHV